MKFPCYIFPQLVFFFFCQALRFATCKLLLFTFVNEAFKFAWNLQVIQPPSMFNMLSIFLFILFRNKSNFPFADVILFEQRRETRTQDYECHLYLSAQFDSVRKTLQNSKMKCTNMKRERLLVGTGNQTIQDTWTWLEKPHAKFFPCLQLRS